MDRQVRARGGSGFENISASPQCLKCGSTDLLDLENPPSAEQIETEQNVENMPERAELARLLAEWTDLKQRDRYDVEHYGSTDETLARFFESGHRRETICEEIGKIGKRLEGLGGVGLMYKVCKSFDSPRLQDMISSCWGGIGGWQH